MAAAVQGVLVTAAGSRIGQIPQLRHPQPLTSPFLGLQTFSPPSSPTLCFDVHQCLPCRSKSMLIQLSITSFDGQTKLSFVWVVAAVQDPYSSAALPDILHINLAAHIYLFPIYIYEIGFGKFKFQKQLYLKCSPSSLDVGRGWSLWQKKDLSKKYNRCHTKARQDTIQYYQANQNLQSIRGDRGVLPTRYSWTGLRNTWDYLLKGLLSGGAWNGFAVDGCWSPQSACVTKVSIYKGEWGVSGSWSFFSQTWSNELDDDWRLLCRSLDLFTYLRLCDQICLLGRDLNKYKIVPRKTRIHLLMLILRCAQVLV